MKFVATALTGAYIVEPERLPDHRGFFARTFCEREFREQGLNPRIVQCSVSFNHRKGTWRGLHYQIAPFAEVKLVRCTKGAVWDVIVDLRMGSPTHCQHVAVELSAENRRMLYIPEGFAHGFQTLEDDSEVFYQMSEHYSPDHARGCRWNDPVFRINLPMAPTVIADRDAQYPDFTRDS